ncbi:MAG TPA: glycosyltransferase [Candidatus Dormibacteraeota bacterium]
MRPRVSLISHAYLEESYRSKLRYLGERTDLTLVTPARFPFAYRQGTADFSRESRFAVRAYPCRFPAGIRSSTRWILKSRDLGFVRDRPHIIHVENELHSFILLQSVLYRRRYAPHARLLAFVWANQRLQGVKGLVLNSLARRLLPSIDLFIAGSSAAQALLTNSGIPSERLVVIPQVGIDVELFKPADASKRAAARAELGVQANEFVIGYAGRLVESKGLPDLVDAVAALAANTAESHPKLVVVGQGPFKDQLLRQCPSVTVASAPSSTDLLPFYHAFDVFVLPSRTTSHWKEQFGRVLTEAMACGVPVIGSDSGAIPEVIGDAGIVFPEGNHVQLRRILEGLCNDGARRAQLQQAGRRRVVEHFSGEAIATATLQAYNELLAAPGP